MADPRFDDIFKRLEALEAAVGIKKAAPKPEAPKPSTKKES